MNAEKCFRLPRRLLALVFVLTGLTLAASEAHATTVIVPSDAELIASSRAIVEGTVSDITARRLNRDGDVYTYITVDVSRVFAGDLQPGRIVLKQRGGVAGNHFTQIYGTPTFALGERVLLFLTTDRAGALQTTFMFLGKYSIVDGNGRAMVVRDHADEGVLTIARGHDGGPTTESAYYDDFVHMLASHASTPRPATAALLTPTPAEIFDPTSFLDETPHDRFTLMSNHARWFEPDDLQTVKFKLRPTPILLDGGETVARDALAAWSNVPGSSMQLEYDGETELCGSAKDGENTISFDDCLGQVSGSGCYGIIAIGGARGIVGERKDINGVTFTRITDADVVLNDGQNTCLTGRTIIIREIITHELGHCIGLGHSSERGPEPDPRLAEATMYYQIHEDGRGASIKADDIDGLRFIYPESILPPGVATESLASGNAEDPYIATFASIRGEGPFTWSVTSGDLPPGLTLSTEGELSGVPTDMGTFAFTVTVTDARDKSGSKAFTLDILRAKPTIASAIYQSSRKKLTILCNPKGPGEIEVIVNGVRVSPPAKLKRKPVDGEASLKLIVKGAPGTLNITQPTGSNTLVVTIDGTPSAQVPF